MKWRVVIGTAIGAVLFAGYSVLKHRDDSIAVSTDIPQQPGYYLKDATLIKTDVNSGLAAWRLHAASITRNPNDDSVSLEQVNLIYTGTTATAWLLTSQYGYIPSDSHTVNFSGAVHVEPHGDNPTMPMTLQTDALSIDTQSNLATAPGKVTIQMNQQRLTAVGLKADLQRQTVRLLTQVHGEFRNQ